MAIDIAVNNASALPPSPLNTPSVTQAKPSSLPDAPARQLGADVDEKNEAMRLDRLKTEAKINAAVSETNGRLKTFSKTLNPGHDKGDDQLLTRFRKYEHDAWRVATEAVRSAPRDVSTTPGTASVVASKELQNAVGKLRELESNMKDYILYGDWRWVDKDPHRAQVVWTDKVQTAHSILTDGSKAMVDAVLGDSKAMLRKAPDVLPRDKMYMLGNGDRVGLPDDLFRLTPEMATTGPNLETIPRAGKGNSVVIAKVPPGIDVMNAWISTTNGAAVTIEGLANVVGSDSQYLVLRTYEPYSGLQIRW